MRNPEIMAPNPFRAGHKEQHVEVISSGNGCFELGCFPADDAKWDCENDASRWPNGETYTQRGRAKRLAEVMRQSELLPVVYKSVLADMAKRRGMPELSDPNDSQDQVR